MRRLQEIERELQQQLAAAQSAAVEKAAAAAAAAMNDAAPVGAPALGPRQEDWAPTAAAAAAPLDDKSQPAYNEAGQPQPAVVVPAGITAAESISSLQQQLRQVNAERLKKQRLVRLLKDAVPYSWDKR